MTMQSYVDTIKAPSREECLFAALASCRFFDRILDPRPLECSLARKRVRVIGQSKSGKESVAIRATV
jgi:hypothetical protein